LLLNQGVTPDIQLSLNQADNASIFAQAFNPELSDEQKVFFDAWLTAFLRLRELDWFNYQAGTLDFLTWESYLSATKVVLSIPNFRSHWSHARGLYDQKFASTVDAIIDETPSIDTFDEFFG